MGKKQKKTTSRSWKKSVAAKEYEETMEKVKEEQKVADKLDKELFFEDKEGSKRLRKVVFDDEVGEHVGSKEKLMIKNLKKKMETKPLVERKRAAPKESYDLWAAPAPKKYDSKSFLRKEDFEISKKERKSDRVIVKPNAYPAVPLPKPGTSYNPDKEQHQDVLGEQLAMELRLEDKEIQDKQLPGGLTLQDIKNQKVSTDVLTGSLLFDEDEDEEEETKSENEEEKRTYTGPTVDKKISEAKRRRKQEADRIRREAQAKKKLRQLYHEIDQSKKIVADVEKEEEMKKEEKKLKEEEKELREKREIPAVIRGGKAVFETPKVDVLLSDEVTGDLRRLHNVTNPVYERMESIDRRHLVQMGGKKTVAKFEKLRVKKGLLKYRRTHVV